MDEAKSKRDILVEAILEKTNKYTRVQIEDILDLKEKQILNLVLSQTNLETECAKKMLEDNDYNSIKVIKMHFGIVDKKPEQTVNINQQVYKEIRHFMDTAAKKYRYTKEIEKRREDFLEFLKEREIKEQENKEQENKEQENAILTTITEEIDE